MIKEGTAVLIGALILVLILVAVFPVIKNGIAGLTGGNITAAETAMFGIIGIVLVVAVIMVVLKAAKLI